MKREADKSSDDSTSYEVFMATLEDKLSSTSSYEQLVQREQLLLTLRERFVETREAKKSYENELEKIFKSRFFKLFKFFKKILNKTQTDSILSRVKYSQEQSAEQQGFGEAFYELLEEARSSMREYKDQIDTINKLRGAFWSLGFREKAYEDLRSLITEGNLIQAKLAAWELALWHSSQQTTKDAEEALSFLHIASFAEKEAESTRKIAILKSESYSLLGNKKAAKDILETELDKESHQDLYLALANLENQSKDKLVLINKALNLNNIAPIHLKSGKKPVYDRLDCKKVEASILTSKQPLVSIIVPAYNAESTISTTLTSLQKQTWTNLEILVVDDCSSDTTTQVVESHIKKDDRVKLFHSPTNSGPYVARNIALQQAVGEFVTVNDADDWSHPQKIEIQVKHLLNNSEIIANMSEQARATDKLSIHRRESGAELVFANFSSLLFRRQEILDSIGFWDSVRFAGDSEFVRRIKKIFGEQSIENLATGPLSFPRQTSTSLTASSAFGYTGYQMGARREYREGLKHYHETSEDLYFEFPLRSRPFPVPDPMHVHPKAQGDEYRHFDIVIMSDFCLPGGTTASNLEEIKAQSRAGISTALVNIPIYGINSNREINPKIRNALKKDSVELIVPGEHIKCSLLIIRQPRILQEYTRFYPKIKAKNTAVIVNQLPKLDYSENGRVVYEIPQCIENLKRYLGDSTATWRPIGPLVRQTLHTEHSKDLKLINLSDKDWVNIINVDEWSRDSRPKNSRPVIGRMSGDGHVKWPEDKETLLNVYPGSDKYEIRILGGANTPRETLGYLPKNWNVYDFGSMHPAEFLKDIDVFVYYTHSELVEAFGRVIFEAMAASVPVILPYSFEPVFGEAAIYAEPEGVQHEVDKLMQSKKYYSQQVDIAQKFIENHYGYSKHLKRLKVIGVLK